MITGTVKWFNEGYVLALRQGLEAATLDARVMHEYILADSKGYGFITRQDGDVEQRPKGPSATRVQTAYTSRTA